MKQTYEDFLDLMDYVAEHVQTARGVDPEGAHAKRSIEAIGFAIGRLCQARTALTLGFAKECLGCGTKLVDDYCPNNCPIQIERRDRECLGERHV